MVAMPWLVLSDGMATMAIEPWPLILPSTIVRTLLSSGYSSSLGPLEHLEQYWAEMSGQLEAPPPASQWQATIPYCLWGDEGTIKNATSWMLGTLMFDLSPHRGNSKASRYLMYSVPTYVYCFEEPAHINITLQEILQVVVDDLNELATAGLQIGDEVFYFRCVAYKGDMKYLVQSLNLQRHATREEVCFRCAATKGNYDFSCCYTDVSENAAWRSRGIGPMWTIAPAMSGLIGFSEKLIALDLLHVFHLGVARDLCGTGFKLLCKGRDYYSGSKIDKRLLQLTKDLKDWCKRHGHVLSLTKVNKDTIKWKSGECPELRAKGADTLVCLRFLCDKLHQKRPMKYDGIVACAWASVQFMGVLSHASLFMTDSERSTAVVTGRLFVRSYISLAYESLQSGDYLFKVRPKMHYLLHIIDDIGLPGHSRNPFSDATFVDEDFVKQALIVKRRISYRKASLNVLRRFCVINKSTLDKLELAAEPRRS